MMNQNENKNILNKERKLKKELEKKGLSVPKTIEELFETTNQIYLTAEKVETLLGLSELDY